MRGFRFKVDESMFESASFKAQVDESKVALKAVTNLEACAGDPSPSWKRGWMKFLTLESGKDLQHLTFFKNMEFNEQAKKPHDMEAQDEFGPIEIPDHANWFFILTSSSINVVSSRRNVLTKNTRSLPINAIKPIFFSAEKGYQGGLEDTGNFREGFCFSVITMEAGSWVCCAPNLEEKEDWMRSIAHVKGIFTILPSPAMMEGEAIMEPAVAKALMPAPMPVLSQTGPTGQ